MRNPTLKQVKRHTRDAYTIDVTHTLVYEVTVQQVTSNQESNGAHVWVYGDINIPWHQMEDAIKDVVGLKTSGDVKNARRMRLTDLDRKEKVRYRFRIDKALNVCLSLHVHQVA